MNDWLEYALGGASTRRMYRQQQPPQPQTSTTSYEMTGTFTAASAYTEPAYQPQGASTSASGMSSDSACAACSNAGVNSIATVSGAGMNGGYYMYFGTATGGITFFSVIDNAFMFTGGNYATGGGFILGYLYATIMSVKGGASEIASLFDGGDTTTLTFQMVGPFKNNMTPAEVAQYNPFILNYMEGGATGYVVTTPQKSGSNAIEVLFENQYVQCHQLPVSMTCSLLPNSKQINVIQLSFAGPIDMSSVLYLESCANYDVVACTMATDIQAQA